MINIKLHLKKRTMIFLIVTFMITICTIGDVSASHAWTINDIDRVKAIEIPTLPTTGVLGDANKYVIVYNNFNTSVLSKYWYIFKLLLRCGSSSHSLI